MYLGIDDIKVPKNFEKQLPSSKKLMERINHYRANGCFDRDVIVDENNTLVDGYTVYLASKMIGIGPIRCIRVKSYGVLAANAYQQAALRTAGTLDRDALLLNGVMGLCGESGECIDMVKKSMFQGHELDEFKLAKELGDVAWYLAVAAHSIGYDLETILKMNIQKLKERYPDGFDAERSTHRKEGDV